MKSEVEIPLQPKWKVLLPWCNMTGNEFAFFWVLHVVTNWTGSSERKMEVNLMLKKQYQTWWSLRNFIEWEQIYASWLFWCLWFVIHEIYWCVIIKILELSTLWLGLSMLSLFCVFLLSFVCSAWLFVTVKQIQHKFIGENVTCVIAMFGWFWFRSNVISQMITNLHQVLKIIIAIFNIFWYDL